MSLIPVVHLDLRISPQIFTKMWNDPNVIFRGLGKKDDSWKKTWSNKSCYTVPLNFSQTDWNRTDCSSLVWVAIPCFFSLVPKMCIYALTTRLVAYLFRVASFFNTSWGHGSLIQFSRASSRIWGIRLLYHQVKERKRYTCFISCLSSPSSPFSLALEGDSWRKERKKS